LGVLHYDRDQFEFDDRVLAHLQIVATTKLRRREAFTVTWNLPAERGSGRHSLWMDNGIPMHFAYHGSRPPAVNREWIDSLMTAAGRPGGLILNEEPPATPTQS
jgi:hypothetical protein